MKRLFLVITVVLVFGIISCTPTSTPTPAPAPAPTPAPAPAPTPAPVPTPAPPPTTDEPDFSEEETCAYIWSRLPSQLPNGYNKTQFSTETKKATYEGNGKWTFVVFGFVEDIVPLPTKIYEKIADQWVEQYSQEVTTYELKLSVVFYEKTRAFEIVDIEKFNERVDTEISETAITRKELMVLWVRGEYSGYGYHFEGSVENTGKIPIRHVQVELLCYDSDGNLLTTERSPLDPDVIAAGELAHFNLRVYLKGMKIKSYNYRFVTALGEEFYRFVTDSGEEYFYHEIGEETTSPLGPVSTVGDYVEPTNRQVRDTALSALGDAPPEIEVNSEAWKIWQLNRWVANNISYISDPKGEEYFAYAHQTLETKGGDCDDFAILLASMYEAVGLDAVIACIDTDGDGRPDHMVCLVYWPGDADSFLNEEQAIMDKLGLTSPTGEFYLSSFSVTNSTFPSKGYTEGIWITADPPMADLRDMVGYIIHKPYKVKLVIDVGN